MFHIQQKVMLRSTDELPTKFDGEIGWIHDHWKTKPEWWTVLRKTDGETAVYHYSQIQPVGIKVGSLRLTQEGFRHPPKVLQRMIEYVKSGGIFNLEGITKFDPTRTNLVAISRFEDGAEFVRDGFHRVAAIYVGRPDGFMYEDEFFYEDLTYIRMNTPRLNMKYYTPFDPRIEVRIADFAEFKDAVEKVIERGEDPIPFINANRESYAKPKKPFQESVKTLVDQWLAMEQNCVNVG